MSQKRMKNFREKLKKDPAAYQQFLAKERIRDKERREKKKQSFSTNPLALKQQQLKTKERVQKHRQIKKSLAIAAIRPTELGSYSCKQTLGKAFSKVKKSLPESPTKRIAVVQKLVRNIVPVEHQAQILNIVQNKATKIFSEESKEAIIEYYCADKNSWQSPGRKDTISVINATSGEKEKIAKRFLIMSVSELYANFKTEFPEIHVSRAKFFKLRPEHVKCRKNTPHNICTCIYHENFESLTSCISEKIHQFPSKSSELVKKLCCNNSNESCMRGTCVSCPTLGSLILEDFVGTEIVRYKQWIFSKNEKRLFQKEITESLICAVRHLEEKSKDFKIHYYINKEQSSYFEKAIADTSPDKATMQIDYAEKYSLKFQDEAQSAYYNKKLITIFTCCVWSKDSKRCFAVLSDYREQNKYTVWYCLKIIFEYLKKNMANLREVEIFSDGAGSQFKNRHTLSNLVYCKKEFSLKIVWNFSATSHGKGAVDGIGAVLKQAWWLAVKSRQKIFSGAKDCHDYSEEKISGVKTFLVKESEIKAYQKILEKKWQGISAIPQIKKKHFFLARDDMFLESKFCKTSEKTDLHGVLQKKKKLTVAEVYTDSE